ncbi:uncharacterized protein V6R79_021094 [Siganus canaliculatus]
MGICCCRAESPCSSAEERSGLLSDDGKAAAPAGEKHGGGTCGPDGDDCKRKTSGDTSIKVEVKTETVQVKQSLEAEPNNTQENGPLLKGDIQTSTPSPKRESELQENSTRAQHVDMKDCPADSHQADLLTCTLDTAQEVHAAAECQGPGEQENPASVQDKTLVDGSVMTNEVYHEILTQADAAAEHISLSAAHDNSEEEEEAGAKVDSAVDEQSQQQMNEAPSGAAHQPALVPAVGEEVDKEALSCDVTKDLHCGSSSVVKEAEPEVVNSPDVSEITSGSEPLELNHSGEETGSEKHAPEPETTARTDPSESSTSNQDEKPAVEFADTSSTEVASLEVIKQDVTEEEAPEGQDEDEDAPTAEEEEDAEKKQEMVSVPMEGGDGERKVSVDEEKLTGSSPADVEGDEPRATEKKDAAENDLGNSEEDLYRGADELSAPPDNDPGSPSEPTFLKVEDRCSLAPAMDILSYSEREWKGNTAKSALIRKGYKDMSQRFSSLRRVRGDNYCALRATLFQVLTHSTQLPPWLQEQDVTMLPSRLEAQEGLISQWTFPGGCLQAEGTGDATLQLQGYMELLQNKVQAAKYLTQTREKSIFQPQLRASRSSIFKPSAYTEGIDTRPHGFQM